MKKFYTFVLSLIATAVVYGQCSPNATYTDPGIYPPAGSSVKNDSIYVLPSADLGMMYSQTVDIVVPVDTTVTFGTATITADIDSMRLVEIRNMPMWLNYACNIPVCSWEGGDNGCVNFSGTAPATGNTWLLDARLEVFANLGTLGQVVDTFSVWIELTAGTLSTPEIRVNTPRIEPNPVTTQLNVEYFSTGSSRWQFDLMDLSGRVVYRNNGQFSSGMNKVNIKRQNWPEGMYLYRLRIDGELHTGRVVVRDGL